MRIPFVKNESSRALEAQLRSVWTLPSASQMLFCSSTEMALQEISKGLFSRFPHRISAAIQEDIRPEFELVIPALTREAVKIQRFRRAELQKDPQAVVTGLGKLGLFVLTASQDPLTGLKNSVRPLAEKCIEARIPFVCVESFPQNWSTDLQSGMVLIVPLHPCLVVLIAGEKVGFELFATGNRSLPVKNIEEVQIQAPNEQASKIQDFESLLPVGLTAPLKDSPERYWDRAVLCCSEMDGSALVDEVGRLKNRNLYAAGILVGSACYWEQDLSTAWLTRAGWTPEQIQGLVIIPVEELENFDSSTLASALASLKALQG